MPKCSGQRPSQRHAVFPNLQTQNYTSKNEQPLGTKNQELGTSLAIDFGFASPLRLPLGSIARPQSTHVIDEYVQPRPTTGRTHRTKSNRRNHQAKIVTLRPGRQRPQRTKTSVSNNRHAPQKPGSSSGPRGSGIVDGLEPDPSRPSPQPHGKTQASSSTRAAPASSKALPKLPLRPKAAANSP